MPEKPVERVTRLLGSALCLFLVCEGGLQAAEAQPAPNLRPILDRLTKEMSRKLPIQVDSHTQLDHVNNADKSITFFFSVADLNVASLDKENFQRTISPGAIAWTCGSGALKNLLALGAQVKVVYRDRQGTQAAAIPILLKDCPH
jgi:hypothetical protein